MFESVAARGILPLAADLIERGLNLKTAMREAAQEMTYKAEETMEQTWRAELAEVERQTRNLASAVAKDIITDEQARETSQELSKRKAKLERDLAKVKEKAEVQRELLEAVQLIEGNVEQALWSLLENQPRTLNQILKLVFKKKSIVLECWGPSSKRYSKVISYELTERFTETVMGGIEQSDR